MHNFLNYQICFVSYLHTNNFRPVWSKSCGLQMQMYFLRVENFFFPILLHILQGILSMYAHQLWVEYGNLQFNPEANVMVDSCIIPFCNNFYTIVFIFNCVVGVYVLLQQLRGKSKGHFVIFFYFLVNNNLSYFLHVFELNWQDQCNLPLCRQFCNISVCRDEFLVWQIRHI